MAFIAEVGFGVADITGAFIAGLIISNTSRSAFVASKFDAFLILYVIVANLFCQHRFAKVVLPKMSVAVVVFAVLLCIIAILTKIVGCGLGAKLCGYENYQCKRIGVGMISRGWLH